jgi:hypothetical protein
MTNIDQQRPVDTLPAVAPRRAPIIVWSVLIGLAIAVLWSAQLADDDIGLSTANGLLGQDATSATITGTLTGLVFAFVTGLAGTFTACNVAVFSAIAPMVEDRPSVGGRVRQSLRPLGWLTLGAVVVAGVYGAIGALLGSRLPQLSTATVGDGVPVRILQSVTVFGVIGLVLLYLGLAALHVVPDPLGRLTARWAAAPQLVMGVLIGGFLIGRPWPLFHKMFEHAASTHNAFYGAGTFVLVAIGNMLLMGVLFVVLSISRFPQWLRASPTRIATVTAVALLIGGAFTFIYWDIRVPAALGFGWFPKMPWH